MFSQTKHLVYPMGVSQLVLVKEWFACRKMLWFSLCGL